ncbi:MAG: Dabb family protein [Balneolaceae bacterium]|nr:Dabb family protein [Balneolaceae bacterium]
MNILLLLAILPLLSVAALVQQSSGTEQNVEGPFVHTVYFWLENPNSEADHEKLQEGLEMIADIDLIQQGFVGVPAPTDREVIDSSYDFSITFIFEDMESEQAYQTHPTHLKFVEEYSHLWNKVVVYDAVPPGN